MVKTLFAQVLMVILVVMISGCMGTKPDLKPLIKLTDNDSIVVLKAKVENFFDLRTTERQNMSIILTNKTNSKIYTGCVNYQNGLMFIPNLPKGNYKISYLIVPLMGDKKLIAGFDDKIADKTQSEITNYDDSLNAKLFGFQDVLSYNSAALDFNIDSPGMYYLGNYSVSNIGTKMFDKGKSYIKKIDDQDTIKEIKSFLTNEKTSWDESKIYYSTNVFYRNDFYLN